MDHKRGFASDNSAGVHPRVLEAIARASLQPSWKTAFDTAEADVLAFARALRKLQGKS